jgi:RNA polymerase sigma factor (sigma-70 family)
VARCAEETRRYLERKPYTDRYCYALFRRALVERDERAWDALYIRYAPLVRRWAARFSAGGEDEELVTAAFARFWLAIDAEGFAGLPDVRSLLTYLRLCVRSAALDRLRAAARTAPECPITAVTGDDVAPVRRELVAADDVESATIDRLARQEFWDVVRRHLRDEREVCLIRLSYLEGLPPRDICRRAPEMFPSVHDVYRLKRTVLDRLRDSDVLRDLAGRDLRSHGLNIDLERGQVRILDRALPDQVAAGEG